MHLETVSVACQPIDPLKAIHKGRYRKRLERRCWCCPVTLKSTGRRRSRSVRFRCLRGYCRFRWPNPVTRETIASLARDSGDHAAGRYLPESTAERPRHCGVLRRKRPYPALRTASARAAAARPLGYRSLTPSGFRGIQMQALHRLVLTFRLDSATAFGDPPHRLQHEAQLACLCRRQHRRLPPYGAQQIERLGQRELLAQIRVDESAATDFAARLHPP